MFLPEEQTGNTVITALASGVEVLPPESTMERLDAERLCQEIEYHQQKLIDYYTVNIRSRLIKLRDGKGYKALGYESMHQLCEHRFKESKSEFYRQLEAAEVEQSMGLPVGTLKTSHAAPLRKLPESDRKAVFDAVQAEGKPTEAKLRAAAVQRLDADLPPRSALFELYSQYGTVTPTPTRKQPNAFQVVRSHPESSDELRFQGLRTAWEKWNEPEFQAKVQDAIARFGDYAETVIPNSCLTCLHHDVQHVGAADGEVYCNLKRTGIHTDRVVEMASTGCWKPEDEELTPEENQAQAELERTKGVPVLFRSGDATYEGIAMTVEVKYIRHGVISYKRIPLDEVLAGLKAEK